MTATALLFRDDAYLRNCDATVVAVTPEGGVILDRTICYAQGGGQPGDVAVIVRADGENDPRGEYRLRGGPFAGGTSRRRRPGGAYSRRAKRSRCSSIGNAVSSGCASTPRFIS